MALATRCPSCSTVFRISTAQAAAKGGMVRCGFCEGVFNSLDALVRVEDLDVIDEVDVATLASARADMAPAHAIAETAAETAADAVDTQSVGANDALDASPADATGTTGASTVDERVEAAAPEPAPRAWWVPEPDAADGAPAADPSAATPAVAEASSASSASSATTAGPLSTGRRGDAPPAAAMPDGTHPTFMRPDPPTTAGRRAARRVYGFLSLLAALALLAQATYLWRDELAARFPPAKSTLTAACRPLRCTVDYPAHPEAISIESASVQSSGPNLDVYVMTALLRNREPLDVRYPHLELVLTDLQDRPILRRALRPEDYLPPLAARDGGARGGFPAESELPIRVVFELNGVRFVGYRLDRFYP